METTFIYALIDPRTKQPRYIGKANKPGKRYYDHLKDKGNTYKANWIKSLIKQGLKPELEIIDEVPVSEWEFWERHYISLYKSWGFNLTNYTLGGEGQKKGYVHSQETKEKLRLKSTGRILSKEAKTKISVKSLGKKKSKKACENMSIAKTGKTFSDNHKLKISEGNKGKTMSLESREKNRIAKLGRKFSEEHKHNMSTSRLGRQHNKEAKQKMSIARKGNKYRLGSKASDETKLKMKLAHTGKKRGPMSEEHKEKIKLAFKKKIKE